MKIAAQQGWFDRSDLHRDSRHSVGAHHERIRVFPRSWMRLRVLGLTYRQSYI